MDTKITCGSYKLHLASFHTYRTYAGLLAGIPNAELNEGRIARALNTATHLWGCKSPHLIPPVITRCDHRWRPIDDNNSNTSSHVTVQLPPLTETETQALAVQSAPDEPKLERMVKWVRTLTGEMLPPNINFAWLESGPINQEYCASKLVLIWFAPDQLDKSLSTIVAEAVRDISWAELAEDFDF